VPFLALTLLKDAVGKRGYSLFYTSFPGQPWWWLSLLEDDSNHQWNNRHHGLLSTSA
jgi:hypothetical protein